MDVNYFYFTFLPKLNQFNKLFMYFLNKFSFVLHCIYLFHSYVQKTRYFIVDYFSNKFVQCISIEYQFYLAFGSFFSSKCSKSGTKGSSDTNKYLNVHHI